MFEGCAEPTITKLALIFILLALSASVHAQISTITIDSIDDQGLDDPSGIACVSTADDCTLRSAIQAANNRPGQVIIQFDNDIPTNTPAGFSEISPQSPFPQITTTISIQGDTHPSFNAANGTPAVLINGAAINTDTDGLHLASGSSGSFIRNLSIHSFSLSGIVISATDNVTVSGNYIGLASFFGGVGSPAGNDGPGLRVANSSNNLIENNWIGDNGFWGVLIQNGSSDNVLTGNRIGLRPVLGGSGSEPTGNGFAGIIIGATAGSGNQIGQCTITFDPVLIETCIGNVIAANVGQGIAVEADGQTLRSNFIGVLPENPTNGDFGNTSHGILLESDNNVISSGLNIEQTANVIGHNNWGIRLVESSDNVIAGNFIGTNANGDDLGNGNSGIQISGGGNTVSQSRIAFSSRDGIELESGYNEILDNTIHDNGLNGIRIENGGQLVQGNTIGNHAPQHGILFSHDIDATSDGLLSIYSNYIGVSPEGDPMRNSAGIAGIGGGFSRIGNDAGRGNVIGSNGMGILLQDTSDARIQANWIGVMPDGTPAGNDSRAIDIRVSQDGSPASNNRIGYRVQDTIPIDPIGEPDSLGNIIAHNANGVRVTTWQDDQVPATRNAIRGNRLYANSGTAILLYPGGGTIDPGGAEEGPNRLQNFPEFDEGDTVFNTNTGEIEFTYLVNTTTGNASYPLLVDFYIADGSSRQGQVFLYTDEYTGFFAAQPKSGSFEPPAGVDLQDAYLVATATDSDGNTSQFSEAIRLTNPVDEIFQDRFEEVEE